MINFEKYPIDSKLQIVQYFNDFGEGSCQHSFAISYCFDSKYDDYFCVYDNFLYALRNGL